MAHSFTLTSRHDPLGGSTFRPSGRCPVAGRADATLKPPWVCAPAGDGEIFSQVSGPWERMAAS
jgi:hypothetical protein